jgi:hypothetical protein
MNEFKLKIKKHEWTKSFYEEDAGHYYYVSPSELTNIHRKRFDTLEEAEEYLESIIIKKESYNDPQ